MKKKILVASLLSVISLGASAESPSFNYFEAGSTTLKSDRMDGDFNGYEVEASYQVSDDFYLSAKQIATTESDLEMSTSTFGVGYIHSLNESAAMYAQIDYAAVILERANAGDFEDKGFQLTAGVKAKVTDSLEFDVALKHLSVGEVDSTYGDYDKTLLLLGANYHFTSSFSTYVDYENEEDSERYSVGLRYSF